MSLRRKGHLTLATAGLLAIELGTKHSMVSNADGLLETLWAATICLAVSALRSLANLCWDMIADRPQTRRWYMLAYRAFGIGIVVTSIIPNAIIQIVMLRWCVNPYWTPTQHYSS